MLTRHWSRFSLLALLLLPMVRAGATSSSCEKPQAAAASCALSATKAEKSHACGDACGTGCELVANTAGGSLTRGPLDHYGRLAALSGVSRAEEAGLDRQQFSLAAMSPSFLKVLDIKPTYLDLPPTAFQLPEFPANSSAQTRAELDHLLELQARRTDDEIAMSRGLAGVYYRLSVRPEDPDWQRMRRNLFHMGHQLGPWFTPDSLPLTADFMARVWSDASYYLWAAKFRFNRVRPYTLEPRLKNLETPNFPAYPSGHSSNSWVAAYVYEILLPEHRDLFSRNARDMAYSREILGVHFASDSEAGRLFARHFVDRLMKEPKFRKDLEAARQEIRKVMSHPTQKAEATNRR
jgi:acid phosphatase (class A)